MESTVSIFLNHFVWAPYFKEGGRQLGLGLDAIGEELMLMEEFPEPVLAKKSLAWRGRLVHRLMQQLPWQTHGEALWVNGDPEQRHQQWRGPGFEFRVPASRLDEVMRVLMPLARQLRAQVMVPAHQFWFIDWNDVSPGAETLLRDWDAAWNTPPMEAEIRRVRVLEHLKRRLEPIGFAFDDGPDVSFRFIRPLRLGGGYQMVEAGAHPFWLKLIITSERYFGIERLRGALLDNVSIRGYGARGRVVSQDIQNVCRYPFDTIAFQEDAAWFFDEFDRLFLPALEHLHTAKDIYEWYWDEQWKAFNFNHRSGMHSVYAARYLPDIEFQVIADEFMKNVPKGPMNEFARFMLTQPQFPDDLP